jgi:Protein of unknown function (DUF1557).
VRLTDKALNAANAVNKLCCFVAGTLVDTEQGLRPIDEIAVGDRVWARDEETGETALKEVIDLIQRHERVIWEVSLTGANGATEKFETTDDHPWWIAGQGWKRTEELVAGMAVVTRDGRGMVLVSVVETERTDSTYNLTVADFETYFVGEQRVLVHNCPARVGDFTRAQKQEAKTDNAKANKGKMTCERCGRNDLANIKSEKGVSTPSNQAQVHHNPAIQRGGGRNSKPEVVCPECHKREHLK